MRNGRLLHLNGVPGRRLLHSHFIAEFLQHGDIVACGNACRCQHIAGNGGIGTGEEGFFTVVAHGVAPGGDTDSSIGDDEPDDGDNTEFFFLCHRGEIFIRRSGDGGEKINGGGFDSESGDVHEHVDAVLHGFPESHDAAAAYFKAGFHGPFDSLDFLIVRMRRTNVGKMAAGGLQIVMVAGNSCCFEFFTMFQ